VWSVLLILFSVLCFCFACLRYMPCAQYCMHSCLWQSKDSSVRGSLFCSSNLKMLVKTTRLKSEFKVLNQVRTSKAKTQHRKQNEQHRPHKKTNSRIVIRTCFFQDTRRVSHVVTSMWQTSIKQHSIALFSIKHV
jgi:hypothetical protein